MPSHHDLLRLVGVPSHDRALHVSCLQTLGFPPASLVGLRLSPPTPPPSLANHVDSHSDNHIHIDTHAVTQKRPRSDDIDSAIHMSQYDSDEPITPTRRPSKTQRHADEPHGSAPQSPFRTSRYIPSQSSHSVSSITSRKSSPVKQLQTLADDVECPVTFRDFDNVPALDKEDGDVSRMQTNIRHIIAKERVACAI